MVDEIEIFWNILKLIESILMANQVNNCLTESTGMDLLGFGLVTKDLWKNIEIALVIESGSLLTMCYFFAKNKTKQKQNLFSVYP